MSLTKWTEHIVLVINDLKYKTLYAKENIIDISKYLL